MSLYVISYLLEGKIFWSDLFWVGSGGKLRCKESLSYNNIHENQAAELWDTESNISLFQFPSV